MATAKKSDRQKDVDLDIDEELDWHRRGWIIQRIGWMVIIGIVLFAALGLFGEGVLSNKKPQAGNITVEYQGFFRYENEMKIVVESSGEHIASLSLPQQYLKFFRIIRITPEPSGNHTSDETVTYNFEGDKNHHVSLYLTADEFGPVAGTMRVNNNDIQLSHFIYP